jgi:DNA (cytosine-5)-methyltransferase 1
MQFVSLFAGIGGIDLGLERAGHTCVGQVEIDDYATCVLEKHWPDTPRLRDVREFEGHEFGEFDLLTGGYPCQPFSMAGQRKGEQDERHLWPEVHRIICNVRPKFVLLENVTGHLSLGFGRVLGDLAESGYDAQWDCIPAAAVGAPHRRDRVFILATRKTQMADSDDNGQSATEKRNGIAKRSHANAPGTNAAKQPKRRSGESRSVDSNANNAVADSNSIGCVHGQTTQHSTKRKQHAQRDASASSATLADSACGTSRQQEPHRIPQTTRTAKLGKRSSKPRPFNNWWEAEPDVGRVADGVPNRVDRLKALGNAVVPQVAEWIGRNWLPTVDIP